MHSFKKSKFITQRPGSSARVYDIDSSEYERKSKIPKRTHSLEGKGSHFSNRQSSIHESSTTSMIPRLEWKKVCRKSAKPSTAPGKEREVKKVEPMRDLTKKNSYNVESSEKALVSNIDNNPVEVSSCEVPDSCLESRINDNFVNFKSNVLKIPDYWTDAGHTVSHILKNAVNVVANQYPTADVEAFETEIENILRATETVKHQILAKTEDIINQANKIYVDRSKKEGEPSEEELEKLTQKMEELRNEVHAKNNVFEDLLRCGNDVTHLKMLNKELKERIGSKEARKCIRKELQLEWEKKNEDGRIGKRGEMKKSKMVIESSPRDTRRKENITHSCGDVLRQDSAGATETAIVAGGGNYQKTCTPEQNEKFTQTINLWTAELHRRDKDLAVLNGQIAELHRLCQDHISKFKSFNLQIKLRGICNKAQHTSISKEIQILNDEKFQLAEKNNKLQYYSKDLETTIKKKNLDIYQKEKVINQQKRLLHVRDELIEMLKTRCKIESDKV